MIDINLAALTDDEAAFLSTAMAVAAEYTGLGRADRLRAVDLRDMLYAERERRLPLWRVLAVRPAVPDITEQHDYHARTATAAVECYLGMDRPWADDTGQPYREATDVISVSRITDGPTP